MPLILEKVRKYMEKRRRISGAALGVGLASAVALVVSVVMMTKRGHAASTRPSPGPGRTAVIGDSIVANTNGFVRYLGQNVAGRTFDNFGVVGQGTAAVLGDLRTRVVGHGYDEVIVEGGLNDLGRNDAVGYVTGNLRTIVGEAKNAGLRVVLVTITPYRAGSGTIRQINQAILANGRSWGADVVVDINYPLADLTGGLKSSLIGTRDGLHPNHEGQVLIGQTLRTQAYAN
jgi:lysophospholipase L1-like esterase